MSDFEYVCINSLMFHTQLTVLSVRKPENGYLKRRRSLNQDIGAMHNTGKNCSPRYFNIPVLAGPCGFVKRCSPIREIAYSSGRVTLMV